MGRDQNDGRLSFRYAHGGETTSILTAGLRPGLH